MNVQKASFNSYEINATSRSAAAFVSLLNAGLFYASILRS
jgi:hypothetical protein